MSITIDSVDVKSPLDGTNETVAVMPFTVRVTLVTGPGPAANTARGPTVEVISHVTSVPVPSQVKVCLPGKALPM